MHNKRKTMRKGMVGQMKPMPLWQSLIFFGVPAALAVLCQYFLWPFLMGIGVSEENSYHYQALVVFVFLLMASLVAYVIEGNPLNWSSFKHRFRLRKMSGREWKWTFGGLLTQILLSLAANGLALQLFSLLDFRPPEVIPSGPITNFPLLLLVLLLNIFSEELWWRGYILPRQELQHGEFTWVINGVLWAFFHFFKWWSVPFMLLTTWIIPLITQRIRNTMPGIIIHLMVNSLSIIITAIGLLVS